MSADYYSLLKKAVAGRDAIARDKIYKDAYGLIERSNLSRQEAASYVAALEDAVERRVLHRNDLAHFDHLYV